MLSTRSLELLDYISFAILSLLQPYDRVKKVESENKKLKMAISKSEEEMKEAKEAREKAEETAKTAREEAMKNKKESAKKILEAERRAKEELMKTKKESDIRVMEAERKAKDSRQREEEAIRVSQDDFKIRETIMSKWSRHQRLHNRTKDSFCCQHL